MKYKATLLIASLACLMMSSCASQPERIADTASGRPEVTIFTSDINRVKSEIINLMQIGDFFLQDESTNRLVFTKQLEGGQAFAAQLLLGNSYSTTPVAEISFNLAQLGNSVRVVEFSSISTQMAFGQVNRADLKDNNAWFNDFQRVLQEVKTRVESQPRSSVTASTKSRTGNQDIAYQIAADDEVQAESDKNHIQPKSAEYADTTEYDDGVSEMSAVFTITTKKSE